MRHALSIGLVLVGLFAGAGGSVCAAASSGEIPPELERWQSWVLHGREEALCPSDYNNGAVVKCRWPSRLNLEVSDDGGTFEQRWLIFAEGWVALPGARELWPESVVVDGQSAAVILRGQTPAVRLTPGEHRIMGRFLWPRLPEMIPVPPSLGLLSLAIDGRRVQAPVIDDQGRLWLHEALTVAQRPDEIKVQVFRLFDDTVPMQVTTLLRLDISGKPREIGLDGVLIQGSTPMMLDSPLPARIDADGRLTLQARAGRWQVRLLARLSGPQYKISAGPCPYGDEIWSFQPRHALRMVEILDVPPVEPSQTEMPGEWRRFQAYLIQAKSAMVIKELRRGDPDPAPDQLSLKRTWWLDFDGGGYTVHDEISGTLSRQWSLAMNPPMVLGRVTVAGQDRVITKQGPGKKMGVELRRGHLGLLADARLQDPSGALSAVDWDHDFQSVDGVLNLPPGWRLFSTAGVDTVSSTWLRRWSLLDFFLVLIIALAVYKLRSWGWGLTALIAMVLIYHEPGAPRLVWLHILAVLALLPVLPDGWFKRLAAMWGIGAMVVLLVIAAPFIVNQIRWGIYPQLAPPYTYYDAGYAQRELQLGLAKKAMVPAPAPPPPSEMADEKSMTRSLAASSESFRAPVGRGEPKKEALLPQQDPDALIPTGPGLPDWRWQAIQLSWSGPVAKDHTLKFYLLSPAVNLFLAQVRVVMLALLIWALIDWRAWWRRLRHRIGVTAVVFLALAGASGVHPGISIAESTGFPPPALLDELQQRLLEKPDCLPDCADISRIELVASGGDLQVMLKVNSAERMAVPLPVNRKSWTPAQIILDNAPISGLIRDDSGQLWALVPAGLHTLVLTGNAGQETVIQLPLPLKPHLASYTAQGWRVEGIQADGSVGSSIQLTRLQTENEPAANARVGLPPFLHVERVLHLGLTWQTTTTIKRLTPTGTPIVVNIPLLANESVTTPDIAVEQGQALINMAPDQRLLTYSSSLKTVPLIRMQAPKAVPWTETWVLEASAIWHCDFEGIPVVHHQDTAGQWQPQWQPWPGEQVVIHVDRPAAVKAPTKTIDRAALVLTPGMRFGRGDLNLTLRTSRGGQQTVELPPKANLQQVTVNGRSLPIRQDGPYVTVPLQPGQSQIGLQWHQLAPFSSLFKVPQVKIGQEAVNARISINMPDQRWILMAGGPRWGPAVLFWSYLMAIALAAIVLGRIPLTPLMTWQWLLLGLGLTQVPAFMALLIVGWLLALGMRERQTMPQHWFAFDIVQIGLAVWSLVALVALFTAVKAGLVGTPEMQIAGNQSSHLALHWVQDHVRETLPQPWVLSVSVWVYRILMLAWSLWLALALLKWLKWGWRCMGKDGMWRKSVLRRKKSTPETSSPGI